MASDFNSTSSQSPQTVGKDPKVVHKESGKQQEKQNERREQESPISPKSNGVVFTSASQQNSPTSSFVASNSVTGTGVLSQAVVESIIQQGFPALAKTTKPIPASVFSYRFASSSNNQTPYYISSDIVLSGGIAQQTRRRIVHNEVERRRKDKINSWITKLAEVIPKCAYGKQSKNIVLENAVEYLTELNEKLKLLEESHHKKNKLELENQALKAQLSAMNDLNNGLIALLEKNNISIPHSLKDATKLVKNPNPISSPTSTQGIVKVSNQPSNTTVTWSMSGKIPTTSASLDKNQPVVQQLPCTSSLNLTGNDEAKCVSQTQPNFSMYTVSSIMNGLTNNISLVDATAQNNQLNTMAITVPSVSSNFGNSLSGLPIEVGSNIGTQTLGNLVPTQNINPAYVTLGHNNTPLSCNLETNPKVISLGTSPEGTSPGVTQVLLCQGTLPQNIVTQGNPILTVAGGGLGSQGTQVINLSPETFVTRGTPVVNCPSLPCVTPGTSVVNVPTGALVSPGSAEINLPLRPIITQRDKAVKIATASTSLTNSAPLSQYITSCLTSNAGLTFQNQGSIMAPSSSTHLLSIDAKRTSNQALERIPNSSAQAPGSITVITKPISQPLQGSNSIKVIPAAIVTQGLVTLTNTVTASTTPVSFAAQPSCSVAMNLPACPLVTGPDKSVVPIGGQQGTFCSTNPQQSGFVALKLPETTIQTTNSTSMTSNLLNSRTVPAVNLTPSPRTAFVIVRSAPSQQPGTFPILPTQSQTQTTNLTYNSVAATKIIPSTIIQPTLQEPNTGTLQTPFTIIATPTSEPVALATSKNTNTLKRSHMNGMAKSKGTSCSPAQPPVKVSKSNNGKKRPPNKTSTRSKSRAPKQQKSSLSNMPTKDLASVDLQRENVSREHSSSGVDLCQQDMLSIQNFSISSLIPSIESQSAVHKNSSTLTNNTSSNNEMKKQGGSIPRSKPNHTPTSLRLSHSIDALTGRTQEQTALQQPQQSILSFSAEALLGTGEDLVSSLPPISCTSSSNSTSSLNMSSFPDNSTDVSINHTFSNFSAEALISETDLIGISNDGQTSRSSFTQGIQSVKSNPSRTQMFSDFSAESLINSSDLGSGLSYAIDNLISRSDNSENNIAMATVNPNLLHSSTSNLLSDNIGHSVFTHSTAGPLVKNYCDFQSSSSTSNDSAIQNFSKYGFTSPQKQPKENFSFKPNGSVSYSLMTTSPTYLKHSVDSITASQHNIVSSGSGVFGSPICNNLAGPSFNSLFSFDQINSQQYQVSGNPFAISGNLTRTSYQGTMGSFA